MKLELALDLDGVVYDFDGHLRSMYRRAFPHCEIPDQARSWDDCLDDLPEFQNFGEVMEFYTTNGGWLGAPLLPGAVQGVERLKAMEHVDLYCLTHRPQDAVNQTHAALHFDLGILPSRVIVTNEPKVNYFFDAHIEDSPAQIRDYARIGRDHLIFDQPWNTHTEGVRARDWDEVVSWVESLV